MRSLFVMDPLDKINVKGDSTYMVMKECSARGLPVHYCVPKDLFVKDGVPKGAITEVKVDATAPYFHVGESKVHDLADFDVIWMRKDPPYDMGYVFTTWLLDMVPSPTLVVNHPIGLKLFNEKLWAMRFQPFHPEVLLSRDQAQIRAFIEQSDGKVVLKPWDGNGGRGVLVTEKGDRNMGSMIEILTVEGKEYVIAQKYIPGIVNGDKRILLFDGKPVTAILRVPSDKDHRGNMHVGATVQATELDERDQQICEALGPELRRWGQTFVGIDVIAGFLTEINVTSPTGIQEANRLYNLRLEADLVDVVSRRWSSREGLPALR